MQTSPAPKLQPLANTDCEEQIQEKMPISNRGGEDSGLQVSIACMLDCKDSETQKYLDTGQNQKETQGRDLLSLCPHKG